MGTKGEADTDRKGGKKENPREKSCLIIFILFFWRGWEKGGVRGEGGVGGGGGERELGGGVDDVRRG